ncbi:hypothetical protein GBAR_LOCUS7835 [Geodia barretti]|uniref:Uncharacterized protein n=1 Tax=Geodia barretti TaxID=519541 RepID=A0AA35RIL6_GEOBA|nr:hypothetical protein GBAR_LOCUS7835 [Geodia barretti]
MYPNGGSLDTGFSQPSADIGTCYCQRQLRRHLALFRGTVRRCNPRCTSLYRCFERQRRGVVHLSQAKREGWHIYAPAFFIRVYWLCLKMPL